MQHLLGFQIQNETSDSSCFSLIFSSWILCKPVKDRIKKNLLWAIFFVMLRIFNDGCLARGSGLFNMHHESEFSSNGHLPPGSLFSNQIFNPSYYLSHKRLFKQQIIEPRQGYNLIIFRSTVKTRMITNKKLFKG